jgi:hypothetical protein
MEYPTVSEPNDGEKAPRRYAVRLRRITEEYADVTVEAADEEEARDVAPRG